MTDPVATPDHLVVTTGPPPWPAPVSDVSSRASAAGLRQLTAEGQTIHIHAHLDVFVNGEPVTVPASIGIDQAAGLITALHTHDTTGIVHIESPTDTTFTLGQLFAEWGVRMRSGCVAGYCAPATPVAIYANGALQSGDAAALVFRSHQEIALVVGKPPAVIPNHFKFPSGY